MYAAATINSEYLRLYILNVLKFFDLIKGDIVFRGLFFTPKGNVSIDFFDELFFRQSLN